MTFFSGGAIASTTSSLEGCIKADNEQVIALFDRWNESIMSGDADEVADRYLSDAVLLPTLSNKVRMTQVERVDYFKHFLSGKPIGNVESRTIRTGCNKAIDSGIYTFTFADNSTVTARYTFTYAWNGNEWKISSHHSSAMPEG
ncbi:SgcJ/EcaC family oxidoreductase [Enterobacteriaceae bacterium ML5]|nr:SgcJ/EcaC family oxidoreductase [Enterobacteriaceae bacterium ML5]